jgi:4-hydroxy-2-oxoheptanedioate aldolase
MILSRVRKKLSSGDVIYTAKACYYDPELVEHIASAGFDGIWICLEHRRLSPETTYALIQACRLGGADAIMRVKPANYTDLLWLLEAGARGIMLPRVRHPDEVREVLAAMKFPPLGRRGIDGIHVDASFGRAATADYIAAANRETCLVVQIEEPEVEPYIDEIASLPGVDVLFVGPADLTLALGSPGQMQHPTVNAVLDSVAAACRRHGKVAAIPCAIEQVPEHHRRGYRFFNVTSDFRCISGGLKKTQADLAGLKFPRNGEPT